MRRPWFLLHEGGKAIEIVGPEALIVIEPGESLAHGICGEPACNDAAGLFARKETRIRQHIEMLHDRGQRHRKGSRQLADRKAFAGREPRQKRTPRGVSERGKGAVELVGSRMIAILNHMV
jgi:hypothetical protein